MAVYICEQCGKAFTGKFDWHNYRFCGKSCAAKHRNDAMVQNNYDPELDWKKEDGKWVCPYRANIGCRTRKCTSCGWNPAVERMRNRKLMVRFELEV